LTENPIKPAKIAEKFQSSFNKYHRKFKTSKLANESIEL